MLHELSQGDPEKMSKYRKQKYADLLEAWYLKKCDHLNELNYLIAEIKDIRTKKNA